MTTMLAPVLGLIGAFVGASLAPWLTSHLAWRRTRREAFDSAISALRSAQSARYIPQAVPVSYLGGDQIAADEFNQRLRERSVDRFCDACMKQRSHSPPLRLIMR